MNPKGILDRWSRSESVAAEQFASTIRRVEDFFDPRSGFFYVAFQRDPTKSPDEKPADPNSATCLVGAALARCGGAENLLKKADGVEFEALRKSADKSYKNALDAPLDRLLPLNTFGPLPLFSTAYLAEFLLSRLQPEDLSKTAAFAIVIRRLLAEVAHQRNPAVPAMDGAAPVHPFLLSHIWRALKELSAYLERAALRLDPPVLEQHAAAMLLYFKCRTWQERALASAIDAQNPPGRLNYNAVIFDRDVMLGLKNETIFPEGRSLHAILEGALGTLRELALHSVNLEIAHAHRPNGPPNDPSALVFGMLLLSEQDPIKHAATLSQGMSVLLDQMSGGYFQAGRPFWSDEKGRSLLVPSVEIANAAIVVALNCEYKLAEEEVQRLLEATEVLQNRLLEDCNGFEMTLNGEPKKVSGWCSDRAATSERIESWVTIHALEFFVNRLRLLRRTKKYHVLNQYSWLAAKDVSPAWDGFQDPDEGAEGYAKTPADAGRLTAKRCIESVMHTKTGDSAAMFLLYGPPGTAKTTFARALANNGGVKRDVLRLSPSEFVAESLDRIESQSKKIFDNLMNIDDTIVIFDEIDSLFRDRKYFAQKSPGSIMEFVIPALLPKLQDFRDYVLTKNIAVFFMSNFYETMDPAITRDGRIDNHIAVLPYSSTAREKVAHDLYCQYRADGISKKFRDLPQNQKDEIEAGFAAFKGELNKLPRNLVYRDVARMMRNLALERPWEDVLALSKKIGVSPSIYDYDTRSAAGRELCQFLARLMNVPCSEEDLKKESDVFVFLVNRFRAMDDNAEYAGWREMLRKWLPRNA